VQPKKKISTQYRIAMPKISLCPSTHILFNTV
jgi:hypothetical protein